MLDILYMFTQDTLDRFTVRVGVDFQLDKFPTTSELDLDDKKVGKTWLSENRQVIAEIQRAMYAQNRSSVLVILQAMDAGGKDSTIRHVFSGVNPQGCKVWSFKEPSSEELQHDFLWRCYRRVPQRGEIVIFNRSYYEEVIVVQVHPEIIVSQGKPEEQGRNSAFWVERYQSIVGLERHLMKHGTKVLKFFLHISKDEQGRRILSRLSNEDKMWKFSRSDTEERKFWDDYQRAYQHCISNTSTPEAPWYVIPGDNKWYARAMISQIIRQSMESMDIDWPSLSDDMVEKIKKQESSLRKELGQ